jgi:hypothetical protein
MSNIQILLNGHVDREKILTELASDDAAYVIEVVANYAGISETFILDLQDLDATNQEAFYKTLDNATALIEADALVWKIEKSGKTFNTEASYIRDSVSTETPLTVLEDGTPLKLVFEIPGFLENTVVEIDLWYNDDFNPTDITALAAIGIDLTGNGSEFTIDNAGDCKLSFRKPTSVTEVYVIDYDFSNEIITV